VRIAAIALAACCLVSACRTADASPPSGSRAFTIRTADGERLAAIEIGRGPRVVVLSHGATGTMDDFFGLAAAFARAGWRAIAYDARGVGDSTGTEGFGATREIDLRAAVAYARGSGARALVLVGGSLGASLSIAMAGEVDADAVVALSAASDSFGALDAARSIAGHVPVLVAAAADNEPFTGDARAIASTLGTTPVIVNGDGHGTGMFADHPGLIRRVVAFTDRAVHPMTGP
jgi:dienelactone hydrolase